MTAALALSATAYAGSDWVEDDHTVFQVQPKAAPQAIPQPAPDRFSAQPQKSRSYLQGSATSFGSAPSERMMPPGRALAPRYGQAQAQAASIGADAEMFIAGIRKDTVVPPHMMKGWLERSHPQFSLNARTNPNAVLEIKGAWDKASQILTGLGIPHREIKAKELRDVSLDGVKVLVVNCEGKIPEDAMEKIRQWVVRGGYLISTDWTLHSFIERAFPGTIAFNGQNTDGTTVDAIIVEQDPILLRGVPVQRAPWKLDEESQMVKVLRPDIVRVLARSYKLGLTDPNRNHTPDPNQWGILACDFFYGRGRVLHLVGHYDYNSPLTFTRYVLPDAIPGAGIGLRQALSTNFLLEGLHRTAPRTASAE